MNEWEHKFVDTTSHTASEVETAFNRLGKKGYKFAGGINTNTGPTAVLIREKSDQSAVSLDQLTSVPSAAAILRARIMSIVDETLVELSSEGVFREHCKTTAITLTELLGDIDHANELRKKWGIPFESEQPVVPPDAREIPEPPAEQKPEVLSPTAIAEHDQEGA